MSSQLRRAASAANLELAWLRLRTSTERTYRDYVQPLYRAFGLAADERLQAIRESLLTDSYAPNSTTKLYFPKPSGLQRVYTLLSVEDHIVYQALANIIADRLYPHAKSRYYRTVFGHLYNGPKERFFYHDWRRSYTAYTGAMRQAYASGFSFAASFDLTACYDSIDHAVLADFLGQLGLQHEFCAVLCSLLRHWTDSSTRRPIYHGHGIPQGPVPSGLLAEVVLRHFDSSDQRRGLRYFRYVDDIRLFAKDEGTLRRELLNLDIRSKQVGLFPQSSKIGIHRISNIEDELKGLSQPVDPQFRVVPRSQTAVRRRLQQLSARLRITNVTQFKFELASAEPHAPLTLRLLELLEREPARYHPICRYLARCPRLTPKATKRLLAVLRAHDLYPGFAAALLRASRENAHVATRPQLFAYCRSRLFGQRSSKSAEVRAAAIAILLSHNQVTWQEARTLLAWRYSAWLRAWAAGFLRSDHLGMPSYEAIVHQLMRDTSNDVALVATELAVTSRLSVPKPVSEINIAGQQALRSVGKLGRVRGGHCPIAERMCRVLGVKVAPIKWKTLLDRKTYRLMIPRVAIWASYSTTDATAWVVLTDTMNDILLNCLHMHDQTIGGYLLGNIGGALQPTSRFAGAYPRLFAVASSIHDLRLAADLAHPVTRWTRAPTGRIAFRDMKALYHPLANGYLELWTKW